jgi:hypothetical protein
MNDPILQYPDFTQEFNLTTDASNYAIGAVLSQGKIGSDKPIAYASRTLNDNEVNYSTIKKELLSIVWATKYFRPYLFGRKFHIVTDHKPLTWLMSLKEPNSRLVRWRLRLEEFDYDIIYKKGKLNSNADALFRIEINTNSVDLDNISTAYNASASVDDDVGTVHSNQEDPILLLPYTQKPLNEFNIQLKINVQSVSIVKPKIKHTFPGKVRYSSQVSIRSFEQDIIKLFKEYIPPNKQVGVLIVKDYQEELTRILQKTFKNNAYNLMLCDML